MRAVIVLREQRETQWDQGRVRREWSAAAHAGGGGVASGAVSNSVTQGKGVHASRHRAP
jgi:hypothetical protein